MTPSHISKNLSIGNSKQKYSKLIAYTHVLNGNISDYIYFLGAVTIRALRDQWGMAGEGVVDRRLVRTVKTHWPERRGWCPVQAQRAVLLVRNPFDAIDSYFNMCLTNTHHLSLTEEVYTEFIDTWRAMMRSEAKLWGAFHQWWLQSGIPLFVVRYEDLRADAETVLNALDQWLQKPLASLMPPKNSSQPSTNPAPAENQENKGGAESEAVQSWPEVPQPSPLGTKHSEEEKQQQLPSQPLPYPDSNTRNGDPSRSESKDGSSLPLNSSSPAASSEGSPYTPRSAGLSNRLKAFARCDEELVAAVVAGAGPTLLKGFGYLPSPTSPASSATRNYNSSSRSERPEPQPNSPPLLPPQVQPLQRRPDYARGANTRPGRVGTDAVTLNAVNEPELRGPSDKFGRYMTIFRKQHTEGDTQPFPVVSGEPYRLTTPVYY